MIPIVLASASPRRKALLEALGIVVDVRPSHADEIVDGEPESVALRNAVTKRDATAACLSRPALVIAADTIVVLGDRILGKPRDRAEACSMLAELSGKRHTVITGVAILNSEKSVSAEGTEATGVLFRDLTRDQIDRFVDAVNPMDRAGAYTVDGPGTLIVSSYDGCYQNVLGLPIPRLESLMMSIGDSLFDRMDARAARFL